MKHLFRFSCLSIGLFAIVSALSSCNNNKTTTVNGATGSTAVNTSENSTATSRMAYVNVDTLQEKYTFWKTEADALEAEQAKGEAEIQAAAQKLQNDYMDLQRKAQAGTLSESEGQAAQQKLGQMQQNLENRRTTLSNQLQKKQIDFSEKLQKNIEDYLEIYNKDKKYDFIFSYTKSGNILHANKGLDITSEVLKGLNEQHAASEVKK
jgi:outer membrane protein